MDYNTYQQFVKDFRKNPRRIAIYVILFLLLGGLAIYLTSFIGEKGRQVANSPETKLNYPDHKDVNDIFRANIGAMIVLSDPSVFLYLYSSRLGNTIAPINMAIDIEVSNIKPITTRITAYAVKILCEYDVGGTLDRGDIRKGIFEFRYNPSGTHVQKWIPLDALNYLGKNVFWAMKKDFTECVQFDFSKNSFDFFAREKQLSPGESVKGWMFFEYPNTLRGQIPKVIETEITLMNSQNETQVIKIKKKPEIFNGDYGGNFMQPLKGKHDLSKFALCHKNDLLDFFKKDK